MPETVYITILSSSIVCPESLKQPSSAGSASAVIVKDPSPVQVSATLVVGEESSSVVVPVEVVAAT